MAERVVCHSRTINPLTLKSKCLRHSNLLVPETGTLMELPMAIANLDIPNIVQFICKINNLFKCFY